MAQSNLPQETQIDIAIPGTVFLVDPEHVLATRHAKNDAAVVLVPAPSNDPDDPLNWTLRRRSLATFCVLLYVFVIGIVSSVINSVIVPFSFSTGISISDVVSGNGYSYLLAGWGLIFWQPFALQYGKRFTYLFTLAAQAGVSVWKPYCTSNGQWIACNILSGFFAAPVEALPEISVSDLYFTHQRATYMGWYALSLIGGSSIGPIIAGFINDGCGYEWVFFIPAIICGVAFFILIVCMEETNYARTTTVVGLNPTQCDDGIATDEKPRQQPEAPCADFGEQHDTLPLPTKSFWQKLQFFDKPRPNHMWTMFRNQIIFAAFPVVLFSGFEYGLALVWTVVMGTTTSQILSAAPYHFSASMVGLTNTAGLLGVFIGSFFGGYINDRITLRLVRKNHGVFEPEMRLWLFTASLVLVPSSLILYGVGAAHHIHWIGLLIASGALSFANTACVPLSLNYLIDSYRDLSGQAMTVVIIVRNTMYFAISYGIQPWIANIMGLQNAYITCSFVGLAATAVYLPIIAYGKACRARSGPTYFRLLDDAMSKGMVH